MSEAVISDGLLKAKPPHPNLSIGKKKVFLAIAIVGILFAIAIAVGKARGGNKIVADDKEPGKPGYGVTSLPRTYGDLPPATIPIQREEVSVPFDTSSKLDELLAKLAKERLERAEAAEHAPSLFQNVSIPKTDVGSLLAQAGSGASVKEGIDGDSGTQAQKSWYVNKRRNSDIALHERIIPRASRYQLMAGTLIPGVLLSGLNSDLPGQILGQVSENVFDTTDGKYLLVPQGTKVIGEYDSKIVYGQERILIVWTRLIFPSGKSISLEGMEGVDLSGYAGLSDQVNNHWGRLLTGVVFSSLLGASAQVAQGRNYETIDPSYGTLATQVWPKTLTM